jgi:hypothetical protein
MGQYYINNLNLIIPSYVNNLPMQIIEEHLNIVSEAEQEISFGAGTDIVVL